MKRPDIRFVTALFGLALTLTFASSPVAAMAAAPKFYVDDPTDGLTCPTAAYSTIQDAINAAPTTGATITVCAPSSTSGGSVDAFSEAITINGYQKLKLVAKGLVVVIPPGTPSYSGAMLSITNSTGITVSGFTFDGAELFDDTGNIRGIEVINSSATISSNRILRIRESVLDFQPIGESIYVENTGAPLKVSITKNTIYDYQTSGVHIFGDVIPTISGNRFDASGAACNNPTAIWLVNTVNGGSVSKNTITHDWNAQNHHCSTGVALHETVGIKVMGNKIYQAKVGIRLYADSSYQGGSLNNVISGNIIENADTGINLNVTIVMNYAVISGNTVSNNTIKDRSMTGSYGILIQYFPNGVYSGTLEGNKITRNKIMGYVSAPLVDDGSGPNIVSGNKFTIVPPGGAPPPPAP
jgi:hypothetical protein